MTTTRTLAALTLALLTPACGGSDPEPTSPIFVVGDDDDDDTADTASGSGNPIAAEVRYRAFFGYDNVLGEVTKPTDYRAELRLEISIRDRTDSEDPTQSCFIRIHLDGYTPSPDAVGEGWLWGLDVPQGDNPSYEEDCTEREFDFETNDMPTIEQWVAGPYYLTLGGDPTQDTLDWIMSGDVTEAELDRYILGEFWQFDDEEGSDDTYWTSTEVDDFGVPLEEEQYVDRYSIADTDGDLNFGYYNMRQTVYWWFEA